MHCKLLFLKLLHHFDNDFVNAEIYPNFFKNGAIFHLVAKMIKYMYGFEAGSEHIVAPITNKLLFQPVWKFMCGYYNIYHDS